MKHTKSPWTIAKTVFGAPAIVAGKKYIASIPVLENGAVTNDLERKENTQLIAAAPEMLEALLYCKKAFEAITVLNTKPMVERIDDVIKKAKGL